MKAEPLPLETPLLSEPVPESGESRADGAVAEGETFPTHMFSPAVLGRPAPPSSSVESGKSVGEAAEGKESGVGGASAQTFEHGVVEAHPVEALSSEPSNRLPADLLASSAAGRREHLHTGPDEVSSGEVAIVAAERERARSVPQSDESLLPGKGDVVAGKYLLKDQLGVGCFGRVFLASRLDLSSQLLVIKVLPLAAYSSKLLQHELRALAAITHPNIVQLNDHGMTEHFAWYTMPWYESITLQQELNRRGASPFSIEEAFDIFLPLAEALVALHHAGFRHQDIKPDNVLLAQFKGARKLHPILIDLGLAVAGQEQLPGGTPEFMSPEQAERMLGRREQINEYSDVYSLAATVLYSIVGEAERKTLFPQQAAEQGSQQVLETVLELAARRAKLGAGGLKAVPFVARRALASQFRRWLTAEPSGRPNAQRFAEQLDVLLARRRFYQRLRRVIAAVGVLLLLLVPMALAGRTLVDKLAQLREQTVELSGEKQELAGAQRDLRLQQGALLGENANLLSSKSELERKLRRLEQALAGLREKEAVRTKNARQVIKDLRGDVEQLAQEKQDLLEQSTEAELQRLKLERSLDQLEEEETQLREEKKGLGRELEAARQGRTKLLRNADALKAEADRLRESNSALRSSLVQLQAAGNSRRNGQSPSLGRDTALPTQE